MNCIIDRENFIIEYFFENGDYKKKVFKTLDELEKFIYEGKEEENES